MVQITAPQSVAAVEAVLRHHLDGELADAVLTNIAAELLGESHAALADLVTAARNRASFEQRDLDLNDLVPAGSSLTATDRLHLRHTAVHEAAHAVVATVLGRTVLEMHLRSREQITGITVVKPAVAGLTLAERLDAVAIALAGRTADRLINNRICDGSATDLATATRNLAELHWGSGLMDSPVVLSPRQLEALLINDHDLTRLIHKRIIDQADRAEQLIALHRDAIERLSGHLLERRSLYANDLVPLLESLRP
jgi:ATP-dependent Zn protease